MERAEHSRTGDKGAVYYQKLQITSGESGIYLIPIYNIYAIGARQENGYLSFTMDSKAEIEAATAIWEQWDGLSEISKAITAFKFTWESGTATAAVTIKVEGA